MPSLFLITTVITSVLINIQCSVCRVIEIQGPRGPVLNLYGPNETLQESWAYVKVRPKANMFYWLYPTTHPKGYLNRPLIMWLQGGPGGSSTGFGNFQELGPLDTNLRPRNTTWLQLASLLFVDNPVGTGYSYVEDPFAYTKNIDEISADLLTMIKAFIKSHQEFQKIPFYIFSESYGGKMTAAFSSVLDKAIRQGELVMNFQGFAMGDSWISPIDSVMSWGPYLGATSIVSPSGQEAINKAARKCQQFVAEGKFAQATNAWNQLESIVEEYGSNVNFYNIMKFSQSVQDVPPGMSLDSRPYDKLFRRHVGVMLGEDLNELMNGPIRKKLKIIPSDVIWGSQAQEVFLNQNGDFMKNVTSTVNALINEKKLKVVIYSGQLDLICDVLGTEAWFARLDVSKFFKTVKKEQYSCGSDKPVCYFGSKYENVQFYWILNAGHMVPTDNGPGALSMVSQIIE